MKKVDWIRLSIIFLLTYTVLLSLSPQWNLAYARLVLPLYAQLVALIDPDFEPVSLMIVFQNKQWVYQLITKTGPLYSIGVQPIAPGIKITSTTVIGNQFVHLLLVLPILLAWPGFTAYQKIGLLAVALPFLLILESVDVPFLLIGSVHSLFLANFNKPAWDSFAVLWMNFLNNGGRQALCVCAALLTVGTFQVLNAYKLHKRLDDNASVTHL